MTQTQTPNSLGRRRFTVNSVRRSVFFEPVALLLAILVLPVLSWVGPGGDKGAPRPFQAQAQQVFSCSGGSVNTIIQKFCTSNNSPSQYAADLVQLEQDAVNGYLGFHGIPVNDPSLVNTQCLTPDLCNSVPVTSASLVYTYGRSDLRSGIRAYLLSILLGIIETPTASRTTHQQNLYNWFASVVQADEIAYYQNAYNEFLRWQSDPCTFTLDPTIASAYSLSYDGVPYCSSSFNQLLSGPPIPAESYFTTFGLTKSYGAPAQTDATYAKLVAGTSINVAEAAGIGATVGVILAAATASLLYASSIATATAFASVVGTGVDFVAAISTATVVISQGAIASLGTIAFVAGPVGIVILAIAIAVSAGMQAFSTQATIDDLNGLQSGLTNAQNNPPDLLSFATDSSGHGMYKLVNALVAQTVPEEASTAALPSHATTDPSFVIQPLGGATQLENTLTYQDWSGNIWSAQTRGGWLVQTCVNGSSSTCDQKDSFIASIHYVDWSGTQWIGSRDGNSFVSTKTNPASTDVSCQASLSTGISTATDDSKCKSYAANFIQLLDGNGNKITASIQSLLTPGFTNTNPIVFAPGTPSTQTITATGNPAATVCFTGGTLPAHVSLPGGNCGTSGLEFQFDGSAQAATSATSITLAASNPSGSFSQAFTIYIATALQFISPATVNVNAGFPVSFLVQTTGSPTPTITDHMNLGGYGLSLTDNHNGTATISGTPTALQLQCVPLTNQPCGIYATNGANTIIQNLTINTTPAPSPVLVTPRTATFLAGFPNRLVLVTTGAKTPVSWSYVADPNASWLNFTDNGDGTATLSGIPPIDAVGSFTPQIDPEAVGAVNFVGDKFTINIIHQPRFVTGNSTTFTVGQFGQFTIFTTFGVVGLNSVFPSWLSWFSFPTGGPFYSEQSATMFGQVPAGSGGQYQFTFSDGSGDLGPVAQNFTLTVNEPPHITSPNLAVMFAGKPGSVNVTTLGFPQVSTKSVSLTSPPTDPGAGDGMYFTVTGLPASLKASNLDAGGFATGTLTISGTPSTADVGAHKVTITPTNAVGTPVPQTLTLQVYPYNPTTAVNLVASETFSRDSSNNVVATVIVANAGSSAAANVAITSAKIGSIAGTVAPASIASIPPATTAVFTITFPAASLGASGSPSSFSLNGTYTGGTFSSAGRMTLP